MSTEQVVQMENKSDLYFDFMFKDRAVSNFDLVYE